MTYKVCRKRSTTTFKINNQVCKVFLNPLFKGENGHWIWELSFAIGKSKRDLNDWFNQRKNKRANRIKKRLTGKNGLKPLNKAAQISLQMRWQIEPGDCILVNCQSKYVYKQFKAMFYWLKHQPDIVHNSFKKQLWWHRPPYPGDPIYELGKIIPAAPANPLAPVVDLNYFDSFRVEFHPQVLEDMLKSMVQKSNQSDQVQSHCTTGSNQNVENQLNPDHPLGAGDQTLQQASGWVPAWGQGGQSLIQSSAGSSISIAATA
jgi:hypothetical protein